MIRKVQFTAGCPNRCSYCHEPPEVKSLYYNGTSQIYPGSGDDIQILDMNFLANPDAWDILSDLPKGRYELVCGIDFRRLNENFARLFKEKGFWVIRWAWDYGLSDQFKHQRTLRTLENVGFHRRQLRVFILVNWMIPFSECTRKLDALKVWGIQVQDCCFDGGYDLALHGGCDLFWTLEQIRRFRRMCRDHNHLIRHNGILPELGKRPLSMKGEEKTPPANLPFFLEEGDRK